MTTILENISLKTYNTFGVEAKARYFSSITSKDILLELIEKESHSDEKCLIIGGGSNILFTRDFNGWVLVNEIKGIKVIKESEHDILVKVAGGEPWSDFVDYCVSRGWCGIENLSLIPGKVGAAPVQNIGAYGVEQKELMVSLEACNLKTGKTRTFLKQECNFAYRSSIFKTSEKGKWFILNVTYQLQKNLTFKLEYEPLKAAFQEFPLDKITLVEVSDEVKRIRRLKLPDPKIIGNAGSFFKNPVISNKNFNRLQLKFPKMPFYKLKDETIKIPAGWLIEACGWKGRKVGNAGVHDKQALVLVNFGPATGQEIFNLSKDIKTDVFRQFGITLEPEVLVL